jgi:hypothetical protein
MTNRTVIAFAGTALLLTFGWGCAKNVDTEVDGVSPTPLVNGVVSEVTPDGKGPAPYELCVSVEKAVTGNVWLYAANETAPRVNWTQWFSASPVASGSANNEICGAVNFALQAGDKLVINGAWANGKKYLVYKGGADGSAADQLKEIWIDDRSYEVGKECAYESNGKGGYNVVCTLR